MQVSYKLNLRYVAICFVAIFLTFLFHEGTHYITGRLLGYDMWMDLNSAGLVDGQSYDEEWQKQLVSISGPIFTILQAIVFFYIIKKTKNLKWYPFVFGAAIMRVFAGFISLIGMSNDEARVSEWLGLGKMTLHIIVIVFLIYLVVKITNQFKINWKFNLATYLILSIAIASIVLGNQYVLN